MRKSFVLLCLTLLVLLTFAACNRNPTFGSQEILIKSWQETDTQVTGGNAVTELMLESYSADDFIQGEVEEKDLALILRCAQKAPSAKNAQPWHFTVITNDVVNSELLSAAKPGNVLVVISGNPDIITDTLEFDCGLAAQNIQLSAESLGYGCRMYLEARGKVGKDYRELLEIPKDYRVIMTLLIGPVESREDGITSATSRNPLGETVTLVE